MGLFGFGKKKKELARQQELNRQQDKNQLSNGFYEKVKEENTEDEVRKETVRRGILNVEEEIKEAIKGRRGIAAFNYRGLTVAQDTELRNTLRGMDVFYKVYKTVLVRRALAGTEFESLSYCFEGPTALVVFDDKNAITILALLSKLYMNDYSIVKGAYFEGKVIDVDGIKKIAEEYIETVNKENHSGEENSIENISIDDDVYTFELVSFGSHKMDCIKLVRELGGLGLKEAKELVERAPEVVKETEDLELLNRYKEQFNKLDDVEVNIKKGDGTIFSADGSGSIDKTSYRYYVKKMLNEYQLEKYGLDGISDDNSGRTLYLIDAGSEKVKCIKIIHDITGLGLKESKDIADNASYSNEIAIKCFSNDADATVACEMFNEIDAKIVLK